MGVGQESTFSPVLSALYLAPILYLFEWQARCSENLLNVSTLLFVDDGLLISQERDYNKSLSTLKYSYNVISYLFTAVGLVLEYKKLEIFHFSRTRINLNLLLDLTDISGPILYPKDTWRYLEVDLMPTSLYLKKLLGWSQLRVEFLPRQHALRALLHRHHSKGTESHPMATAYLMAKQNPRLKSPIQNINHCLNQVHLAFDTLNLKLRPGFHIIDLFSDCISFFPVKHTDDTARRNQISKVNNLMHAAARQTQTILIVTDASVKKRY